MVSQRLAGGAVQVGVVGIVARRTQRQGNKTTPRQLQREIDFEEAKEKALDKYEGAMVLVSHVPEFVRSIRIDDTLDLSA